MKTFQPSAALTGASVGSLVSEQQQELTNAQKRATKILRAAKIATINGWIAGLFAVSSLGMVLVGALLGTFSITSLVMGIGLAAIAYNEFRGRRLLRQFDLQAPSCLGWNQLAFIGLLVVYSLWCLYWGLTQPDPVVAELKASSGANLDATFKDLFGWTIEEFRTFILLVVYGSLIVFSVFFQGLNALYYFRRHKPLQAYLSETPAWIVEMQRAV